MLRLFPLRFRSQFLEYFRSLKFLVEKKNYFGEFVATKTDSLDMHVMNKYSLTRCIDGVVNE